MVLRIEDIIIPSSKLDHKEFYTFIPSKIKKLRGVIRADDGTTHSTSDINDLDYNPVVVSISLSIRGLGKLSGCCPEISKDDFRRLKQCYGVTRNKEMFGKLITTVYSCNVFVGFIPALVFPNSED
jgi:hypothetical protein